MADIDLPKCRKRNPLSLLFEYNSRIVQVSPYPTIFTLTLTDLPQGRFHICCSVNAFSDVVMYPHLALRIVNLFGLITSKCLHHHSTLCNYRALLEQWQIICCCQIIKRDNQPTPHLPLWSWNYYSFCQPEVQKSLLTRALHCSKILHLTFFLSLCRVLSDCYW